MKIKRRSVMKLIEISMVTVINQFGNQANFGSNLD